jgi:gamma-glutamylcyclotransferase (GGCT)/AIG2-like uncharacterized protein YtfP
MEKNYQLFVYGSLRSGFHHPAFEYISRHFLFVGNGKIKGLVYDMGAYPGAIQTSTESSVIGEVYVIKNENEFDWAIAQLDDYEGVDAEEDETPLFKRALTEVYLDNVQKTTAWIYWFNGDITGKPVIASGDTLQYYQEKNKV